MMRTVFTLALSTLTALGCATTASTSATPTAGTPVAATAAACAGEESSAKAAEPFGRLSIEEVAALIERGEATVFDNNSESRFAAGHLPGAVRVGYDAVTAERLPADKQRTLVFYCANEHCSACHKAAAAASALGYARVFIMPAGIKGWESAGRPVERS